LHDPVFAPAERNTVAEAAGRVIEVSPRTPSSGDKARTVPISPPSDPEYLRNENIAYL